MRAAIEPYASRFAPEDPVSLALCTSATDISPGDAFAAVATAWPRVDRDPASIPDMVVTALDPARHPLPQETRPLEDLERQVSIRPAP